MSSYYINIPGIVAMGDFASAYGLCPTNIALLDPSDRFDSHCIYDRCPTQTSCTKSSTRA